MNKARPELFSVLLVIAVILSYVWFADPGSSNEWEKSSDYFDLLARGFRNAHLYLSLDPDPQLLALPNPYDPLTRKGIEMKWDLSLYQGKYYLYWGPVPALILSGMYSFFHGKISDLTLTLAFLAGLFTVQVLLLLNILNQYFRQLPRLLVNISILLIGLAGPLMLLRHNYEPARVYEVAITGGQFFFMSGMLMALTALRHSAISFWRFALAAGFWTLAIATRQILAVPIGFTLLFLVVWFLRTNGWSFRKAMQFIPAALLLVFGFICLGVYNWARFGSFMETGFYYALAGVNLQEISRELFSPVYILQNFYNYLFNAIEFTNRFPFVILPLGRESFSHLSVPDLYSAEPIAGVMYTFPFLIFAGLPFFVSSVRSPFLSSLDTGERDHWNFITLGLGGSFLMTFSSLLLFFWAGMRYTEDFMPCLRILSTLGFWQGYQSLRLQDLSRKVYSVFGVIIVGASILVNTLLAISTHPEIIRLVSSRFP